MKITTYTKKDGSIIYRSSIYLGTDSITGKKVKTTISGRTKKELKAKALQVQIDFQEKGSTIYKATTLSTYGELVESWWDSYRHTVKPNTMVVYKGMLKNYLLPAFGSYKLDKLTPQLFRKLSTIGRKHITGVTATKIIAYCIQPINAFYSMV